MPHAGIHLSVSYATNSCPAKASRTHFVPQPPLTVLRNAGTEVKAKRSPSNETQLPNKPSRHQTRRLVTPRPDQRHAPRVGLSSDLALAINPPEQGTKNLSKTFKRTHRSNAVPRRPRARPTCLPRCGSRLTGPIPATSRHPASITNREIKRGQRSQDNRCVRVEDFLHFELLPEASLRQRRFHDSLEEAHVDCRGLKHLRNLARIVGQRVLLEELLHLQSQNTAVNSD